MSTRLGSVVNLSAFTRSLVKTGTPHKHWPTIAQLPGVYKPPDVSNFKTNFVAYQVTTLLPFELDTKSPWSRTSAHWLDPINIEGWIPREQILGDEASSKVPRAGDLPTTYRWRGRTRRQTES